MNTCLFTGKELNDETRLEHTILRALGGRIRSRKVSSTEFNNKTSDKFDKSFSDQYKLILSELAPLLPKELAPGALTLVSEDGERTYKKVAGITELNGMVVTKRGTDNKPKSILFPNSEKMLRKLQEQLQWTLFLKMENVPLPDEISFLRNCKLEIEAHISALKCFLLTFDHMLQEKKFRCFTRDFQLEPIRNFLKTVICDEQKIDVVELNRFYFGIQLDKKQLIDKLLKRAKHSPVPYEHTLIVTTDTPHKSLLGIWSVLGIDILGFQLSENWQSDPFTVIITNPIFKNENVSFYTFDDESLETLCQRTPYKCFGIVSRNQEFKDMMVAYFTSSRIQAYKDAVLFLEMHADDFLWEQFAYIASCHSSGISIALLLRIRLKRLYANVYEENELESCLDEELQDTDSTPLSLDQLKSFSCKKKAALLQEYREVLQKLNKPFQAPGHMFLSNQRVETETIAVQRR